MAANSPNDMMSAVTESMRERTGRTVEEWVAVVKAGGLDPLDQKAVRKWLKSEHGILQNSRWAIADAAARAAGWKRPANDEYVAGQYSGAKEGLLPIFTRIREIVEAFGEDIRMEGRSTYIPFTRRRQFAAVQAATRARVDVGVRFTDAPASDLLVRADSPGQATHRFSLSSVDDVTPEVVTLLRLAYGQNG